MSRIGKKPIPVPTGVDVKVSGSVVSVKGPLGKLYPHPCCIHEGDTPSFLGLINNGLASFMSPTYGGWGGRYVWRTFFGETRPSWTQVSYPHAGCTRAMRRRASR